jgi:hypothetical protein
MDNGKYLELKDVVRKLSADSPRNEIEDIIVSMSYGDPLTKEQAKELDDIIKMKISQDVGRSFYDDYF